MMDFPLPCPSGCGTPLMREELLALREKHPSSVYFSRELMAKYFTYSAGSGTHFVLFDDAETLRQKCALRKDLAFRQRFSCSLRSLICSQSFERRAAPQGG